MSGDLPRGQGRDGCFGASTSCDEAHTFTQQTGRSVLISDLCFNLCGCSKGTRASGLLRCVCVMRRSQRAQKWAVQTSDICSNHCEFTTNPRAFGLIRCLCVIRGGHHICEQISRSALISRVWSMLRGFTMVPGVSGLLRCFRVMRRGPRPCAKTGRSLLISDICFIQCGFTIGLRAFGPLRSFCLIQISQHICATKTGRSALIIKNCLIL